MSDIRAGKFEIDVWGPYPCWTHIKYDGKEIASIHHNELSDLLYAIRKAMYEARSKLPDNDKDEVML